MMALAAWVPPQELHLEVMVRRSIMLQISRWTKLCDVFWVSTAVATHASCSVTIAAGMHTRAIPQKTAVV
jgi:hypothetical protein